MTASYSLDPDVNSNYFLRWKTIWSWSSDHERWKKNEHSKPNWSSTSINVTPKHTKKSPNNCSYSNYCTNICTNIGRGSNNRSAKKPAAIRVSGTPNFVKQNIPGKSAGDLYGMFVWPLQGLSDLQLGDEKVTLNHLVTRLSASAPCYRPRYSDRWWCDFEGPQSCPGIGDVLRNFLGE